jgi:cell division protein FtsW (lipid II flippase)
MVIPIPLRYILAIVFAFVAVLAFFKVAIFSQIAAAVYLSDLPWKIFVIAALLVVFIVLYKLYEINKIFLTIVFLTVLILSPTIDFVWNNLMLDYHKERIEIFVQGEETDPLNSGYQVQQSIIAIGSGRVTGRGYLKGGQVNSKKLPYPYTDFIFAAWSEQFGFIGVIAIFSIYSILFYRILQVLESTKDVFGKLIVIGILGILITNFLIHTAMNQGMIPVTGVPLPIISYGGSSILVFMIGLGLVQMVKLSTETQDLAQKFKWFNAKVD